MSSPEDVEPGLAPPLSADEHRAVERTRGFIARHDFAKSHGPVRTPLELVMGLLVAAGVIAAILVTGGHRGGTPKPTFNAQTPPAALATGLPATASPSQSQPPASPSQSQTPAAGGPVPVQTTPNVVPPNGDLNSVACPAPGDCWAVGSYVASSNVQATMIEHYAGSWTQMASSNDGTFNYLSGVACASGNDCWAVGYDSGGSDPLLLEHWNGASWSAPVASGIEAMPAASYFVFGVSCADSSHCFAVGYEQNGSSVVPLVDRWNGTVWTPSVLADNGQLWSISCVGASFCFAVGQTPPSQYMALVERWDGTTWSRSAADIPNRLNGVACSGPSFCAAVGTSAVGNGSDAYFTTWDGASWTNRPPPAGPGTPEVVDVNTVACLSPTSCWAVGQTRVPSAFTSATLVYRWDGMTWTLVSSPNGGGTSSGVRGVACSGSVECFAVGASGTAGDACGNCAPDQTLIVRWDGVRWNVVPSANGG